MNQKETMIKVLRYIKKYWLFVGFSLIFAAITVVCTLYVPILTGDAIDLIIKEKKVDFIGIGEILKQIGIIVAITGIAQWIMNICNNHITYRVVEDVRQEAIRKLQKLPLKYIDGHSQGDVVSRVIADVDQFADGLLMGFSQLFTGVITILGTLLFMLSIHGGITIVVVVMTPLSLFVAAFIAKRTYTMFRLQSETRGEQTAFVDEMIGNEKVVQAYNRTEKELERFDEINERLKKYSTRAIFYSALTNPCTRFVNNLVYTAVGIVGAFFAVSGRITVGQLSCF